MKNKKNIILLSIIVIISLVLIYNNYIIPQIDKNNVDDEKFNNLSNSINKLKAINVNDIKNEIEKDKLQKNKLDNLISDTENTELIIDLIYNLVKKNNLSGNQIQFSRSTTNSDNITSINVSFTGNLNNIKSFINELQNYNEKLIILHNLTINKNDKGECLLNTRIDFYFGHKQQIIKIK